MCFYIWLYTKLNGRLVGDDEFGNQYYESKWKNRSFGRRSRWVYYKGKAEPSKIPGHWYTWLHHQTTALPKQKREQYKWEKMHTPNLTGTVNAYYPAGHPVRKGKRHRAIGDYQRWRP